MTASLAGKTLIGILVAISACGPLALNIFVPSMPGLRHEFGTTADVVQLTLTLYLIGTAVFQLVYGPLSDRLGRRPVVLLGLVIFVLASFWAAMATSIEELILARVAQAVGGASGITLARAIVRDVYSREKAASVIGYVTMSFAVAPMVAPSIGGFLDLYFSWRAGFVLVGIVGAVVLFLSLAFLKETRKQQEGEEQADPLRAFALLLGRRRFLGYVLSAAFSSAVFFSFLGGVPLVMTELLKRTPLHYGIWFAIVSLGYIFGNFLAGRYSERIGIDTMVQAGILLSFLGCALSTGLIVAGYLVPASIFLPMMLIAIGNGMNLPNAMAGSVSVYPALAGTASGLAGFTQLGLGALMSQSVGALQVHDPLAVIYVMLAMSILAYFGFLLTGRETRPQKQTNV